MSAEPKASDHLARFRQAARGKSDRPAPQRIESVAEIAAPPMQAPLPLPHVQPPRRVRFTLDLARDQHRFLKRFAVDEEADASEVLRALLSELERDDDLASTVRRRVAASKAVGA